MKNRFLRNLFLVCAFFLTTGFVKPDTGYLKSATYYSDDWVVNFWNCESDNMDQELAKISADGFNSIILCVPWREFQPGGGNLNSYCVEKLDRVMNTAASHGLSVMLRVGYTWDYYPEGESGRTRVDSMPYTRSERVSWYTYLSKLYAVASQHENFAGGFMTWEDFWTFTYTAPSFGNNSTGLYRARESGYSAYALSHYSLDELRALYKNPALAKESLYFPPKANPAMKVFYEWYDDYLMGLLVDSRNYFPGLSMEVRVDGDMVYDEGGTAYLKGHEGTFSAADGTYTSLMFSPATNHESGQVLSAAEAKDGLNRILASVRQAGGPVYVDQLNFTDNTLGYEGNASISESEKPAFLMSIPGVLRQYTNGYGIWTYRDYGNNKLFNAQFLLDQRGWTFGPGASITKFSGSKQALLDKDAFISQSLRPSNGAQNGPDTTVTLDVYSQAGADVDIILDNKRIQSFHVEGKQTLNTTFSGQGAYLTLRVRNGRAYLDNVKAYNFVTRGEIYDEFGNDSACLGALRQLNALIG